MSLVTELQYLTYFKNLAVKHKQLTDGTGGQSFYYMPSQYDLTELDMAFRNLLKPTCMVLEGLKGRLDDSGSKNYVQYIDGMFMILVKSDSSDVTTIRASRDTALGIGLDIFARMRADFSSGALLGNPSVNFFAIHNANYQPVGPMEGNFYGYAFTFTITCPFGFTVSSASWLDK